MWACLVELNANFMLNFQLNGSYFKTRSRRNFLIFDFLFKHSTLEALKSPRTKISTDVDFHQQQLELKNIFTETAAAAKKLHENEVEI